MNKVGLFLFLCLAPWLYGQSLWELASLNGQYKKIVVPFYDKDSSSPIAIVHVDRVYLDYQKRGFFKIGLLPVLKAEGVKIEILQSGLKLETLLMKLEEWAAPPSKHCLLQIENLEVTVAGARECRLSARQARIQDLKFWQLVGHVEFCSGDVVCKADGARLVCTQNKLEVVWDDLSLAPLSLTEP